MASLPGPIRESKRRRLTSDSGGDEDEELSVEVVAAKTPPLDLASLSDELLVKIASILGDAEDVLSFCQVSKSMSKSLLDSVSLWRDLAMKTDPVLQEVFDSLFPKDKKELLNSTLNNPNDDDDDNADENQAKVLTASKAAAASLWRRCALSRKASRQQSCFGEEPSHEGLALPNHHSEPQQQQQQQQQQHHPVASSAETEDNEVEGPHGYSFLLDMTNVNDSRKSVTIFVENCYDSAFEGDVVKLKMDQKYLQHFPWADDLQRQRPPRPTTLADLIHLDIFIGDDPDDFSVTLNTTFTVYVVNRRSGKQAKLYHSGRNVHLDNSSIYHFPLQDCGTTFPVPVVSCWLPHCWKERDDDGWDHQEDDGSRELRFLLEFKDEADDFAGDRRRASGDELLQFLAKGLVYV